MEEKNTLESDVDISKQNPSVGENTGKLNEVGKKTTISASTIQVNSCQRGNPLLKEIRYCNYFRI